MFIRFITLWAILFVLTVTPFALAQEATIQATIKISVCGDGVVEGPEDCEPGPPEDLNGGTCESAGFGSGTLSCTIACDFDTSLCAAPPTPPSSSPAPAGGGAASGRAVPIVSLPQISFFGQANPGDTIILLKDAQIAETTITDNNGNFFFRLNDLSAGNYIFALYSQNSAGERSSLLTFPVETSPQSVINVTQISFVPGVPVRPGEIRMGDLNSDARVDLVDFSVLIFWFEKSNPPSHVDVNGDGRVDLVDFSILAYYWTG